MRFFLLCGLVLSSVAHAQTPFSSDSAASFLKTISVDIGPRTMGSPGEQQAMDFAVSKFREFGLDASIMPMTSVQGDITGLQANTNSGIVVGIVRGKTNRIILIGGHIDSAGPEIPGANDDGSGSATVLELARVLSKRQNESTIVFCLFGGEEQGLLGSKYFVDHFSRLADVGLMIQIDMANGRDWLIPFMDNRATSAPRWLVTAAYEEFRKLGYSGLSYPTHFFALNNVLPGGGIGSDHMPFLEKNIPAIDFTSEMNDPIHTPQDNFENFVGGGLKRSGDLAHRLVERFDKEIPEPKTESYYFVQLASFLLFIPPWLETGFIVAALMVAGWSLYKTRPRRIETDKSARPTIPGVRIFLLMLIIQACTWFSENTVGLIKGVRFPWFNDLSGYLVLSGLGGLIGVWLALKAATRLRLSKDPYRYALRCTVFLAALILLCSFLSVKLALYPAVALLFISLASISRRPWLKLFFWFLSPYFMYRLIFSEGFPLLARTIAEGSTGGIGTSVFLHFFYIVFFSAWSFPFLLGFASIYFDSRTDLLWLGKFRQRWGIILASAAFAIWAVVLITQPTYSRLWNQILRVTENVNEDKGTMTLSLISIDYLRGARIHHGTKDTTITGFTRERVFMEGKAPVDRWISVQDTMIKTTRRDSSTTFDMVVKVKTKFRPYQLTVSYAGGKKIQNVVTPFLASVSSRGVSLRWYSFPDSVLLIPIQLTVVGADSLRESIDATFVELIERISVEKELSTVITRTSIRQTSVIRAEKK